MTFRDRFRLPAPFRSLRGRVLGALVLALCLLVVLTAIDLYSLRRIGTSVRATNEVWVPLSRLAARMDGLAGRRDTTRLDAVVTEARQVVSREPPGEDAERVGIAAARAQVEEIARASQAGDGTAQTAEVAQLALLADSRIEALSADTARAQATAVRVALGLAGVLAALGAVLVWNTGRTVGQVERLTEGARQMAAGRSPGALGIAGVDEIADLGRSFEQMVAAVAERDRSLSALSDYLRRVLDSIGSAVVVAEADRVRMANPAAATLWGVHEGDPLPPHLADLAEGGHAELVVGERFQDVVVRPFGATARILVGDDVSARRRDREALARSERLALVGQLLAQITHEVRNPLNAMSLHAELLAEEPLGDESKKLLVTITREIRRLEAVTERYLDLARRRAPETAVEDPRALAEGVVGLEEEKLRRGGASVRVEGDGGVAVEFAGNVARQALLNLVRNAGEAGAGEVRVEVAREPGFVVFGVVDDGPGVSAEALPHVFEPFYTTRARGTGLGLAVSRQAVEDAGGTLVVHSVPGQGATFVVRLPVGEPGGYGG